MHNWNTSKLRETHLEDYREKQENTVNILVNFPKSKGNKAIRQSLKTPYMKLCSESALMQSLDYLCLSLYQSDITIFNFFFARQMKDEIMAVDPRGC